MNDNEREERVMKHPRCKHGWMSSCLHGCEDAYRWSHDQLMQLCDAANKLTPDEMRRHIVWFALMSEEESKEVDDDSR